MSASSLAERREALRMAERASTLAPDRRPDFEAVRALAAQAVRGAGG